MTEKPRCRDCPCYKEYVPGVGFCNKDAQFVEAIQEKCGEEEVDLKEKLLWMAKEE